MPRRFGQNSENWTLDSLLGSLEAVLQDEEEIEERIHSKRREKNIERMEKAIELLCACCE